MTREQMMSILRDAHERLGANPSRERLHRYNELVRELHAEVEATEPGDDRRGGARK